MVKIAVIHYYIMVFTPAVSSVIHSWYTSFFMDRNETLTDKEIKTVWAIFSLRYTVMGKCTDMWKNAAFLHSRHG